MREEHKADVREREGKKKKIIIMAQELRSVNFPLLISLARSFLQSRPLRAEVGKPQELAPSWRLARGLRCGSPLLCVAAAPAAAPGSGGCTWWGLPGLLWCRPSAGAAPPRCRGPPDRLAGGGAAWDCGREPGGAGGPDRLFPGAAWKRKREERDRSHAEGCGRPLTQRRGDAFRATLLLRVGEDKKTKRGANQNPEAARPQTSPAPRGTWKPKSSRETDGRGTSLLPREVGKQNHPKPM